MLEWIQKTIRSRRFRRLYSLSALGQFALVNLFLFGFTAFGDDCTRDWRRAED